ncbi:hypothetical protein Tco_0138531 [Tanacetum coccineum]
MDREAVATLITQTTSLQTRLTTALGRIATLEARDPEPQDGPAEAGSSSYNDVRAYLRASSQHIFREIGHHPSHIALDIGIERHLYARRHGTGSEERRVQP